jgi:capsular exopolysaccharide synthesis family protein
VNTVPEKDPSLRDLLRIFDRRRRLVYVTAGVVFFLAVCVCIFMTRRYTASSTIELQKSAADSPSLDTLMGGSAGGANDALSLNVDLQTQSDILQSEALALQVVRELNLEQNEDFKPHFNPIGWVMGLITPAGISDPKNASLENSPRRRRRIVQTFEDSLKVKVNAGTRLTEVTFTNRDPKVAAAVVNHLIQALIQYNFETRISASNAISKGLENQLSELRQHTEELQSKVVALQQGSQLFGVGGTDETGKQTVSSPVLQSLEKSTTQLSQATMNRVLKQAVYDTVKSGNAEAISQLSGTQMSTEGGTGVMGSLSLIETLRTQESTLKSQIEQESTKFGPAYPRLQQDKASLAAVERSLQDEIDRIAVRAKSDYEIAVKAEEGARAAYDADRAAAGKLNDQGIQYAILSKEAEQSQTLYQDLLKRLKEAGIVEGLHSSNVSIVDPATPPGKPSKPNIPVYLTLGVLAGLFLGAGAALLVDALDNKIQGTEEIEAMGLPVLGLVPQIKMDDTAPGVLLLNSEYSVFGEAVRGLRSTLLESHTGKQVQVLLVTSSSPREGKSALALNLAISQAQFNKKVLLVEADMRRPVLRKILGLSGSDGLSDLLSNPKATVAPQMLPDHLNLHCMPAGSVPQYPSELLGSERMKFLVREWRADYDFIVLDCPPVLPVTDTQYLEGLADATFLVARAGATSKIALQRSYQLLFRHVKDPQNPRIGVVLNFISLRSAAYYGYYGYYGDAKYEYEKAALPDRT